MRQHEWLNRYTVLFTQPLLRSAVAGDPYHPRGISVGRPRRPNPREIGMVKHGETWIYWWNYHIVIYCKHDELKDFQGLEYLTATWLRALWCFMACSNPKKSPPKCTHLYAPLPPVPSNPDTACLERGRTRCHRHVGCFSNTPPSWKGVQGMFQTGPGKPFTADSSHAPNRVWPLAQHVEFRFNCFDLFLVLVLICKC